MNESQLLGLVTEFESITASIRRSEKDREGLERKTTALESTSARQASELEKANQENARLNSLVKNQSQTIKSLREELASSALAQSQVSKLSLELCKERDSHETLKQQNEIATRSMESMEKEINRNQERLKSLQQEINIMRAQARRTGQQRVTCSYPTNSRGGLSPNGN